MRSADSSFGKCEKRHLFEVTADCSHVIKGVWLCGMEHINSRKKACDVLSVLRSEHLRYSLVVFKSRSSHNEQIGTMVPAS